MGHRHVVVIAASRGAIPVLRTLVAALPADLPAAVCIVVHIGRHPSVLPEMLSRWGKLPACHQARRTAEKRPDIRGAAGPSHGTARRRAVLLDSATENFARPAADLLFRSAAIEYGPRVAGVVLSGDLDDGSAGLAAVQARGGYCIVQDPPSARRHRCRTAHWSPRGQMRSRDRNSLHTRFNQP